MHLHQRKTRPNRKLWLKKVSIILAVLTLLTKPAYSNPLSEKQTSDALDLAYEFQISAIKQQVKFETLKDSYDLRISQLEQENKRLFWLNVASIVALSYATTRQ